MTKDPKNPDSDRMLPLYDFSNAVQDKYADRFAKGTNLVRIHADVAKELPDSASVNAALRSLLIKPGRESASVGAYGLAMPRSLQILRQSASLISLCRGTAERASLPGLRHHE